MVRCKGDYLTAATLQCSLARKDAKHALNLANLSGNTMKDVAMAGSHLAAVQAHMGSKGDIAGVRRAVRQEAGLKFDN